MPSRALSLLTARLLLLAGLAVALGGCRAMDVNDSHGTHYQNEQRRFYAPEKEAELDDHGHARNWTSGALAGQCSQTPIAELQTRFERYPAVQLPTTHASQNYHYVVIDTITLRQATLFDTDDASPNARGEEMLEQAIERIGQYESVYLLEVRSHTDSRGSVAANLDLSARRAESVASDLRDAFGPVPVITRGVGESEPAAPNDSPINLQRNRRATITVYANRPRDTANSPTLCNYADSRQLTEEDYQRSVGALNERVSASLVSPFDERPPLSVGDRIKIHVTEGEEISGIYEVGLGGDIQVPYLGLIKAHGLTSLELEQRIRDLLVSQQIFNPGTVHISTTVQEWSQVDVFVSGSTFDPGRVTINRQNAEFRSFQQIHVSGDYARDRLLSTALLAAGGIRPDADVSRIQVVRGGVVDTVDLSGIFEGRQTKDKPLAAGDQVVVPSTGHFNGKLVRPTQVTPPGIRIFISSLATPARNNAVAAINEHATSVPYGTRFLRGLVSANCVGGTQLTNADRRAVLISTNPITGRTEVIERDIQQLVSDPYRDDINPYLMPDDGIACYDSDVTNFREIISVIAETITPFYQLKYLFD